MSLCRSALLSALCLLPAVGILWAGVQQSEGRLSTADGVFTERQAKRGERVQRRLCRKCHIPEYYTGGLLDSWVGNTVGALNNRIIQTMPQDRPNSLKPDQSADLMAYLLKLNKFPAGEEELPSDDSALAKIIIERSKK